MPRIGHRAKESVAFTYFYAACGFRLITVLLRNYIMFAVIQTGGKQYKVAKDDIIIIEKLDIEAGKPVSFGEVLACGAGADIKVGEPLVKGAEVKGEVLEQRKGDKVMIFKKKRRQNYRRKRGHRQNETVVKITSIKA
jgi:large subunit ribosomal protein L21